MYTWNLLGVVYYIEIHTWNVLGAIYNIFPSVGAIFVCPNNLILRFYFRNICQPTAICVIRGRWWLVHQVERGQ